MDAWYWILGDIQYANIFQISLAYNWYLIFEQILSGNNTIIFMSEQNRFSQIRVVIQNSDPAKVHFKNDRTADVILSLALFHTWVIAVHNQHIILSARYIHIIFHIALMPMITF